MINRGVSKTSQYFFNATTGMLEKLEENVQTIESLSNQLTSQIDNLEDIGKEVNKKDDLKPINNITVITADDNLIHNYFTSMDVSWDASNCLSVATIKMPKMNTENTNYWTTYTGQLTIYAGYNFTFDYVNSNSNPTEKDAANSLTKYWDNSDILPFFRGEISKVKEFNTEIVIHVDNIGRRFQQKIPDEFRQSYIYNQNVRDAFQAICEFLGVKYICPPKTMADDGEVETEDEETTTDGTENDINKQLDTEKKISSQAKTKIKQANKKKKDTQEKINGIANSINKQLNTDSATKAGIEGNTDDKSEDEDSEDEELTNNKDIDEGPQNGYGDINFDANGAIVHGSTVIETSPDMAETLLAMDENPLEKYLDDETGIVEDVQKLLNGEMFDELHNNVMNYDAITVEPKSATTSDMSTAGGGSGNSGNSSEDEDGGISPDNFAKMNTVIGRSLSNTMQNRGKASSGKASRSSSTSSKGTVNLSIGSIRKLSPAVAATMSKNPKYSPYTVSLLKLRASRLL